MGAGQVIALLVGHLPLDAAQPLQGRCRGQEGFCSDARRTASALRLARSDRLRRRHRPDRRRPRRETQRAGIERSPTAALAPVRSSCPPREALAEDGVAAVARPRRHHQRPEVWTFLDQGSIRCCERRLASSTVGYRQEWAGRPVDAEAYPVVPRLGRADLRRLHEHHPLHRIARPGASMMPRM